jgi:hypothetical protein
MGIKQAIRKFDVLGWKPAMTQMIGERWASLGESSQSDAPGHKATRQKNMQNKGSWQLQYHLITSPTTRGGKSGRW